MKLAKLQIILAFVFVYCFLFALNISAATIYANYSTGSDTTGDGSAGSPYKTFHKAYTMASSGDTLNLTGTFTWTNADETGDAVTTGYTIGKNLTIQGQAAGATFIQAASSYATGTSSVFTVSAGVTAVINDITVRYGYNRTGSDGGGINNNGTLTVNRCNISYNYVWYYPSWGGYGGGICNKSILYVNDSTVDNNFAQSQGGGIVNYYTAGNTNTSYITNTTIAFNSTADVVATVGGAGFYNRSGTSYITNSTVAYNNAPVGTGCTTGVSISGGTAVYLKNSIVASNKVGGVDVTNYSGNCFDVTGMTTYGSSIIDNGGNIFGKVNTAYGGVSFSATSWYDLYGNSTGDSIFTKYGTATTGSLYLDSELSKNDNTNGTSTLAITNASSIAINNYASGSNGSVSLPTNDQRQAGRNDGTDIGSFEYNGVGLIISQPVTQSSNITFSSVSYASMTVSWTSGNGSKRVVFAKQANTGTAEPVDSTTYTASTTFGSGTQISDSGWFCVYNGTGNSVSVTGLTVGVDYIFQVFEYNGITPSAENYFLDSAVDNPKSQATILVTEPTTQASSIIFSSVSYTSMTVSWTSGNGAKRVVFAKQANSGSTNLVDDVNYTASATFGNGTQIESSGWFCVYNGTGNSVSVTGLAVGTDYIFQVFEYNNYSSTYNYNNNSAVDNPKSQASLTVTEPTTQASNITFSSVNYTTMTISWTSGNGAKRAVFIKQADTGTALPVDDVNYTASTVFGSGTQIASSGWYCIYNSTGSSVSITGLTADTNYIVQVFEYNNSGSIYNYNTDNATNNPKVQASLSVTEPTTQASAITFSSVSDTSFTVSWTNGNGANRTVFIKAGNSGTATPVDNTAYTANTTFGSGTQIASSGWYCIYNSTGSSVSITGLTADTNYIVQVFEYNINGAVINYFTDSAVDNPKSQATTSIPTRSVFTYTGSSQTLVVPAGVTQISIKAWGAGGGGGYLLTSYSGGAGGYARGTLSVTPGQELFIIVGGGGAGARTSYGLNTGGFGGGGNSCTSTFVHGGGAGGGYSGVFSSSNIIQSNALLIAGGGGGGRTYSGTSSGGGGGTTGGGATNYGGTQVSAGTSGSALGSALQGGTKSSCTGTDGADGPGGGGGYFGGSGTTNSDGGGSGGGSGYIHSSVIDGELLQGSTSTSSALVAPPKIDDSSYANSSGYSGAGSNTNGVAGTNGNNGLVVISYQAPASSYTLTYTAGSNGSISGTTSQTVNSGENGSAVTAVADYDYVFSSWSDGSVANPRTDENVFEDISVTANFVLAYSTIYANSSTGSDTTGDGTMGNPYKTFYKAYSVANSGDVLDLTGTFDWTNSEETGDAVVSGFTIAKNITITGHNADTTIIQADSSDNKANRRVFTIASGSTVAINNLAIRYGKLTGSTNDGGGIKNLGTLTITDCEIYNNRAVGTYGGGISNWNRLTLNSSTVYNNVAHYMGGGLVNSYYVAVGGFLNITNSTIVYNQLTATTAYTEGGGVHYRKGSGVITNSTIAYNTACGAGGVGMDDPLGTLTIKNSILAKNIRLNHAYCHNGLAPIDFDFRQAGYGNVVDNGNNIIGYSYRYSWTGSGDWVGANSWSGVLSWNQNTFTLYGTATTGDINLDSSLAINSNTNKTQTLALQASSIAINNGGDSANGTVSVPTTDQRENSRSGATDIGAFEYGGVAPDITAPVISSISSNVTDTTAVINWETSEESSAQIKYDPSTYLTTRTLIYNSDVKTIAHEITLTGLVACSKYYYIAISQDDAGNIGTSAQQTFTTTGCAGSSSISTISELVFTPASTNGADVDTAITSAEDSDYSVSQTSGGLTFELTISRDFAEIPASLQLKSLSAVSALNILSKPSDYNAVGSSVFDIKALTDPASTLSSFDSSATVTLNYTDADITGIDENTLKIHRNDGSSWYELSNCSVNKTSKTVTCNTTNFSVFGLFGQAQTESNTSMSISGGGNALQSSWQENNQSEEDIAKLLARIEQLKIEIANLQGNKSKKYNFIRDLYLGLSGQDVKQLQIYLNNSGFIIAEFGDGSKGNETEFFGKLTKQALIKFQKQNKINPSIGFFGPITRAFILR